MKGIGLCVLCVCIWAIQGCFLQNFNANAREAGYKHSGYASKSTQKHSAKNKIKSTKKAESTSYKTRSGSESEIIAALLAQQKSWSATPYISGGIKKSGADCSGFVQSVFSESFKLQLPRTTISQMQEGKKLGGKSIKHSKLRAGDLVFFKTGRGALGYHVGIYIENGEFLHLSAKGGAKIASLSNSYWQPKLIKAVRYEFP